MARRIIEQGAELMLREEPLAMPADVVPMGDKSRPSASLMLVPIRNRTKVIGILSIQSYTVKAYDRQDLSTLQALADYCGGALERIHVEQALHLSQFVFHDLFEARPTPFSSKISKARFWTLIRPVANCMARRKRNWSGRLLISCLESHAKRWLGDFALLAQGRLHQVEGLSVAEEWTGGAGRSASESDRDMRLFGAFASRP